MFKKKEQIAFAFSHHVSGADRKKLGRRAAEAFHLEAEQMTKLLPPKTQLAQARFASPSRAALYTLDDVPWMIDLRAGRKDDLIPTVLALGELPAMLPPVALRHSDVAHFVLNGADLMMPGVDTEALPLQLQQRALVSIVAPGVEGPVAVGRMLMSGEAMRAAAGSKGRAVEVLHHAHDLLCGLAPPPASDSTRGGSGAASDAPARSQLLTSTQVNATAGDGQYPPQTASARGAPSAAEAQDAAEASSVQQGNITNGSREEPTEICAPGDTQPTVSPEEMDQLLEKTLLQALVTTVKDKVLPLSGGALWNGHLLPARRAGTSLNLKASTHKKLPKLLQAYGQAGCQLLTVREDRATGESVLSGINRSHPLIRSHVKWSIDDTAGIPLPLRPPAGSADSRGFPDLTIEEQFKPRVELSAVFEAAGADPRGTYSAQQTGEVAVRYAMTADLAAGASSSSNILLDSTLCDALYKGVLKKGEPFPTELPKSRLRSALLSRMLPQLLLTRGAATSVVKGGATKVSITTEKRRNNKKVTRVVGFEAFLLPAEDLAADLRRHFAASATVAPLPGATSKGHEIALQGEVVQKMAAYLTTVHGIPSQNIAASLPAKKKGGTGGQKK